ncbi:hypothetical protein L208DRAFT_1358505 [Tricholoma matsutake]|nr:hypothetical protein L208DRAFT_1358505 [Tricholoma matsutake 945]
MSLWVQKNPQLSITNFPNETVSAIFKELSPRTLAIVARISHKFQALAEYQLYSSVYITDTLSEGERPSSDSDALPESSPIPYRTLRWCESMQRRLYRVESIKKLQIRWQAYPGTPPSGALIAACSQIAHVLRSLIYLESLDIFLGPANYGCFPQYESMHAIERAILGCQFPLLHHCSFGAEWRDNSDLQLQSHDADMQVQPYTSILTSFLIVHTELRHLKLSDHLGALLGLPNDALPHLTSFRGFANAAASLLPGRPIQALYLFGKDSDLDSQNLPRMMLTSVPLRYLDLSAMSIRPLLLRNISTHLSTVETLRIKLALRHTLHYAFSGIRLLAGLSTVLSAFRQLTCIDLSPTDVEGIGRPDAKEEILLCVEWGRACPFLTRIIFPSQSEWIIQDGVWSLLQN